MKYTFEQRLEIGKEIYTRNITQNEAAVRYQINNYTAENIWDYIEMLMVFRQLRLMNIG